MFIFYFKSLLILLFLSRFIFLNAQPTSPQVVHGAATFFEEGNRLVITSDHQTIINWDSFSISPDEMTQFIQSFSHAEVLNRVTSKQMSLLEGMLQANGSVYLLNPNGIVVGKEGVINTAAFIGSTLNMTNEGFLSNQKKLFSGESTGALINLGTIRCLEGEVFLFGHQIENHGTIEVGGGEVGMVVGKEMIFFPPGQERVCVKVPIESQEGVEDIKKQSNPNASIYSKAIKHTGRIDAKSIVKEGGRVFLRAENAEVEVSGEIAADGGGVYLLGDHVVVKEPAYIDVSFQENGGEVCIGGGYKGNNPSLYNALRTTVSPGVRIDASSRGSGDGGRVIIWSDQHTHFAGDLSARGGKEKGDGGFVEVSGKSLDLLGQVDLLAPFGETGTFLIDPDFIIIDNSGADPATGQTFASSGTVNISKQSIDAALQSASLVLQANDDITLDYSGTISGLNKLSLWAGKSVIFKKGGIELDGAGFEALINHPNANPTTATAPSFKMSPGTHINISNLSSNQLGIYVTFYPNQHGFDGGYIDLQGTSLNPVVLNTGNARLYMEGSGGAGLTSTYCQITSLSPVSQGLSLIGYNGDSSGTNSYQGVVINDSTITGTSVAILSAPLSGFTPPIAGINFTGIEINGTSSSTVINGGTDLTISGTTPSTLSSGQTAHGVHIKGGLLTSTAGPVTITGQGPSLGTIPAQNAKGVYIEPGAEFTIGNSSTGPFTIKGTSSLATDPIAIDISNSVDFFSSTNTASSFQLDSPTSGIISINGNIKTSLGRIEVLNNSSGVNLSSQLETVGGAINLPGVLNISKANGVKVKSAGGAINLNTINASTVGNALEVDASLLSGGGNVSLKGVVGASNALGEFLVSGNLINLYDDITTSQGNISFSGPVIFFNSGKTITSGTGVGDITFNSSVNCTPSTPLPIKLNAGSGNLTFSGNVGASSGRIGLMTMNAGTTHLNASIFSNSSLTFANPVTLGASVTLDSGPGLTDIVFKDTLNGQVGGEPLTLNSGTGQISFEGIVGGGQGLGIGTFNATGGSIEVQADFTTKNASMTFNSPTLFSNDPILSSGIGPNSGDIVFYSSVDGKNSSNLTINGGTGKTSFFQDVGPSIGALSVSANPVYTEASNIRAQDLRFNGALQVNSISVLMEASLKDLIFSGTVDSVSGNVNITGNAAGTIACLQPIGTTHQNQYLGNVTFSAKNIDIKDMVLTSGTFAASATDSTLLENGAIIETQNKDITITGPLKIKDQVIFSTSPTGFNGAGDVSFNDTIDLSNVILSGDLTINNGDSGVVVFDKAIGSAFPIDSLIVSGKSPIHVSNNLTTTGSMIFNGPVLIKDDVTFNSVTAGINFQSSISGNKNLTLSAPGSAGSILVKGNVNLTQTGQEGKPIVAFARNNITFEGDILTSGGSGGGVGFDGGDVTLTSNGSIVVKNITNSGGFSSTTGKMNSSGKIALAGSSNFQQGTLGPPETKIPDGKIVLFGNLTGGEITLGAVTPRSQAMSVATITSSPSGNDVKISGSSVLFGPYESMTVLGDLIINAEDTITTGDLVALNNLTLKATKVVTELTPPAMLLSSGGTLYQADNIHILAGQKLSVSGTQSTIGAGSSPDFESLGFLPSLFQTYLFYNGTILGWDMYFPPPIVPVVPTSVVEKDLIRTNRSLSGLLTAELFYQLDEAERNQFLQRQNAWQFLNMQE